MSNIDETLQERKKTHGEYTDNAQTTWDLMRVVMYRPGWNDLTDTQRETIHMTFHKFSRAINGDPSEPDHWLDVSGYNKLIVDQLLREAAKKVEREEAAKSSAKLSIPSEAIVGQNHAIPTSELAIYNANLPGELPTIHVVFEGATYLILDRFVMNLDGREELPRIPFCASWAEFTPLPPYYKALYGSVNPNGTRDILPEYNDLWGK